MAHYQEYRFERIEGYLEPPQCQALRNLSSRAHITATTFHVHYHFSDLKAKTTEVILNYFDIGCYYSDWGAIDAYIKLPKGSLPDDLLPLNDASLNQCTTDQWQLLIFSLREDRQQFDGRQIDAFLQHLPKLRDELLQGDWRLLYFLWLKALNHNNALTPLPLIHFDFNLNQLSQAQQAFIEVFSIPLQPITALTLALQDNPSHPPQHRPHNPEDWLNQLTHPQKDQLLTALYQQGQLTRYQAQTMTQQKPTSQPPHYQHWLTAQLIEPYQDRAAAQLKHKQAAESAARHAAEQVARRVILTEIYNQRDRIWQRAEAQANRTSARGYDQAASDLHQLAEAYQLKQNPFAFTNRLQHFVLKHRRKKNLLKRLHDLHIERLLQAATQQQAP